MASYSDIKREALCNYNGSMVYQEIKIETTRRPYQLQFYYCDGIEVLSCNAYDCQFQVGIKGKDYNPDFRRTIADYLVGLGLGNRRKK